jgi:hypothetical protein
MTNLSRWTLVAMGLAALLVTAGCTSDIPAEPVASEARGESESSLTEVELPEGVTARGVVLAAYLLSSGDIARAVEEALVSPDEVELARQALAEGSLQEWVNRASETTD